jgi:hypothetical protein
VLSCRCTVKKKMGDGVGHRLACRPSEEARTREGVTIV